jgi:hypothetical protein
VKPLVPSWESRKVLAENGVFPQLFQPLSLIGECFLVIQPESKSRLSAADINRGDRHISSVPKPDSRSPISSAAKVSSSEAAAQLISRQTQSSDARSREASDQGSHEGHADSPFGSDHADSTQPLIEKATM